MTNKSLEQLIREDRIRLGNPYAHLNDKGELDADIPSQEKIVHSARIRYKNQYALLEPGGGFDGLAELPLIDPLSIYQPQEREESLSAGEIETITRSLLRVMWKKRGMLGTKSPDINALNLIDPVLALEAIGYEVKIEHSLGQSSASGEKFEVAGIIDKLNKKAQISSNFRPEILRFTTAHELGHAMLHETSGLHRDKPLDGPSDKSRQPIEKEADKFASNFLMPRKLVNKAFEDRFLTQRFTLNDDTAFALKSDTLESVLSQLRSLRDLTKLLASTERYNGKPFPSLASQFKVSVTTMAIRIEELGLASI